MACLIKDKVTGQIVGYQTLSQEEKLRIERENDYEVIPFYDKATCRRVVLGKEA